MFWKKKLKLYAPIDGEFVALNKVRDDVFSSGMMGKGFAVEPNSDRIMAPADGEIISANNNMRHALGLRLENGCELLIHVGIETVTLKNQGFSVLVKAGDKVTRGTELLRFEPSLIKQAGLEDTVMVIVTDVKGLSVDIPSNQKQLEAGKSVTMILK